MGEAHRFSRSTAEEGPRGGRKHKGLLGLLSSPQRGCTGRNYNKNRAKELPSKVTVQHFFSFSTHLESKNSRVRSTALHVGALHMGTRKSCIQLLVENYWLLSLFLAGQTLRIQQRFGVKRRIRHPQMHSANYHMFLFKE